MPKDGAMADQQDRQLDKIFGEYRLLRLLGGGTFGTVYQAEHLHNHAPAAIKLLRAQLARREDFKNFLNEARMMRLHHPHIVQVLDFGVSKEDTPYLVMEYASGGTLRQRHPRGTRLPFPTLLAYTEQLAAALQYAHDQRIIHRDIKPENMLLRGDGTLLLSDFGIAKVLETSSLVSQTMFLGTPAYMAPEQSLGKPCFASDQYALAVVLYEWIAGQQPFQGAALEVAIQHRLDPPPALTDLVPDLPPAAEQVVLKALRKEPAERFPSIATFAQAFLAAFRDEPEASTLSALPGPGTPLVHAPANANRTSPSGDSQPPQLFSPASVVAPAQEKAALALTTSADTAGVAAPGIPLAPAQAVLTPPGSATPPLQPEPVHSKRPRSGIPASLLIFLVLVLVSGGVVGIWMVAMDNTTATTLASRNATATTQAPHNATATTLANHNATATTRANTGKIWYAQASDTSQSLFDVAWSGLQLVAVGDQGTILTSPNGRTWTTQNSGISQQLNSIAWSGSQFVVVGLSGTIFTSPDGHTWMTQNSGTSRELFDIIWSGSQFVVVGDQGTILTSPNGRTWAAQNSGTNPISLKGIVWSGSQFVAVGGGTILTSPDGRTWTAQNSGIQNSDTAHYLNDVIWSGSQFVAVGGGAILTSPDGRTWTAQSPGNNSTYLNGVAWSGSQFVAIGDLGAILTSPDGRAWTAQNSVTDSTLFGIAWLDSQFIAVGGVAILTSP